jgi:hypothetical protein
MTRAFYALVYTVILLVVATAVETKQTKLVAFSPQARRVLVPTFADR